MAKAEFEGVNERIEEVRIALKLSQRQFAKQFFVSQTLVNEVEQGKRTVHIRIIHLIAFQFHVNINWLKKGTGKMFVTSPSDPRLEQIKVIFENLDNPLQDYLFSQSKELLKIQKEIG